MKYEVKNEVFELLLSNENSNTTYIIDEYNDVIIYG